MTAEEMFREIGYKAEVNKNGYYYEKEISNHNSIMIRFINENKSIITQHYLHGKYLIHSIEIEEFRAIQKQIKELRW